jgi:hypothetical protein
LLENEPRLLVGMVATEMNYINLLAGLATTKLIRCTLEAEWLCNNYHKCSAQILQRKTSVSNIYLSLNLSKCCVCISLPLQKASYKWKLFVVVKMKFDK